MRGLLRRSREEDGFTMIVALLITAVVMVLMVAAVNISVHGTTSSSYDRKRVQALSAAEAGLDYYFSYLQSTGGASPACTVTKTLTGSQTSSFTVTATFYDGNGNNIACVSGALPATPVASAVYLRSVGKSTANKPTRVMEAYAKVTQSSGYSFDNAGAIFGNNSINLLANSQVGGDFYNDADFYTNGNVTLGSNSILYGKVQAQGAVTLGGGAEVKRDVWANGAISMQGNAAIRANTTSSTSSITLSTQSHIYGDARAGTTNTGGTVDGYRTANSPSAPPPTRTFPAFTYDYATKWQPAPYNYVEQSFAGDCTGAKNYLTGGSYTGGNVVVRVTGSCTLSFDSGVTYPVKGNLAIITDGSIVLNDRARFSPTGGPWNLFFFAGLAQGPGCSYTSMPNSGSDAGLKTLIYAPIACTVTIKSTSALTQGQILGGTVNFQTPLNFQFSPVVIPGNGQGGFRQDVFYKREVV